MTYEALTLTFGLSARMALPSDARSLSFSASPDCRNTSASEADIAYEWAGLAKKANRIVNKLQAVVNYAVLLPTDALVPAAVNVEGCWPTGDRGSEGSEDTMCP